jgi:hypothetical protein
LVEAIQGNSNTFVTNRCVEIDRLVKKAASPVQTSEVEDKKVEKEDAPAVESEEAPEADEVKDKSVESGAGSS